jgi:hypothetical protein
MLALSLFLTFQFFLYIAESLTVREKFIKVKVFKLNTLNALSKPMLSLSLLPFTIN